MVLETRRRVSKEGKIYQKKVSQKLFQLNSNLLASNNVKHALNTKTADL